MAYGVGAGRWFPGIGVGLDLGWFSTFGVLFPMLLVVHFCDTVTISDFYTSRILLEYLYCRIL